MSDPDVDPALQIVPPDGHPDPVIRMETRPSPFTGFSFWVVLSYKEHSFEEMLTADFPGLSEEQQDGLVVLACERLKAQLRPILEAEDAEAIS